MSVLPVTLAVLLFHTTSPPRAFPAAFVDPLLDELASSEPATPVETPISPFLITPGSGFNTAPQTDSVQGDIVVTARAGRRASDPLAAINAKSFAVSQAVDSAVVAPLAQGYEHALPTPIRLGVRNFLENLHEPDVFVNYILQGKPGKAAETVGRFVLNSTIGVAGVVDVARRRPFNLPRRPNGFADTFGFYGVKPGPFLFLPILGATTPRDLVGLVMDRLLLPVAVGRPFNLPGYSIPTGVLHTLERRVAFEGDLEKVRATSDPYTARRSLYLETRQAEIDRLHGGEQPADANSR